MSTVRAVKPRDEVLARETADAVNAGAGELSNAQISQQPQGWACPSSSCDAQLEPQETALCSRKLLVFLVLNRSKEKLVPVACFGKLWALLSAAFSLCSQLLVLGTHLCRLVLCRATGCLSHSTSPRQAFFFVFKPFLSFFTVSNPRLIYSWACTLPDGWFCSPACCCDHYLPTEFFFSVAVFAQQSVPVGLFDRLGVWLLFLFAGSKLLWLGTATWGLWNSCS